MCALAQKVPETSKTDFTKEALSQYVYTPSGDSVTMGSVLQKHRNDVVVLDLWAGWCKDCIAVMEQNRALVKRFPKVKFIYLSFDRSDSAWKASMAKHQLSDKENYWFKAGWKNKFTNYIDLNWIPRYMVIDKKSKIKAYYIVHPEDPKFLELLGNFSK
ncbi:alkyl hydroperoxide reductase [Taibaiella sp. KBW10]|nr:alkyl hydroperoxide reductase [Taibaiella sp. KBW10]